MQCESTRKSSDKKSFSEITAAVSKQRYSVRRILIYSLPLILMFIDLPVSEESLKLYSRIIVVTLIYSILFLSAQLATLKRPGIFLVIAGTCACLNFIPPVSSGAIIKLSIVIFLWFMGVVAIFAYWRGQHLLAGSGILSLLAIVLFFVSTERLLQNIPDRVLRSEIQKTPPLTSFVDRGNNIFVKNGFRGKHPCSSCPKNTIRIFNMGGSSTYGIPMYYTTTAYPVLLQRILERRRPDENYDVLNAGIPGYGIVQILDSLRKQVLPHKPDIVTVCAWFNDSAATPGWYGVPGKSDMEAFQMVRFVFGARSGAARTQRRRAGGRH